MRFQQEKFLLQCFKERSYRDACRSSLRTVSLLPQALHGKTGSPVFTEYKSLQIKLRDQFEHSQRRWVGCVEKDFAIDSSAILGYRLVRYASSSAWQGGGTAHQPIPRNLLQGCQLARCLQLKNIKLCFKKENILDFINFYRPKIRPTT